MTFDQSPEAEASPPQGSGTSSLQGRTSLAGADRSNSIWGKIIAIKEHTVQWIRIVGCGNVVKKGKKKKHLFLFIPHIDL